MAHKAPSEGCHPPRSLVTWEQIQCLTYCSGILGVIFESGGKQKQNKTETNKRKNQNHFFKTYTQNQVF